MPLLIAVVSLLGVLCLLTLVLTLGVIRRLREHTKLMDALYEAIDLMGGPPTGLATLGKGELVGDFAATTLDGDQVTRELLPEGAVVAFLSADCGGCRDQLPEIASWAAGQDRRQIVAVLDATSGDPEELVTALSPVAQVIVEDELTTVGRAFGLKVFPTFYQVSGEGRLLAVEGRISRLPVGSPA
ncbi:TlpA disulfide reductase family protein [Streptomyces sp. NBC_01198]|uniref:TlpA disulfide reductase family protein n=1 Tax=Streptomyces sp. NBC_01198 TaxID=2903769 RepID=UPI002E10505A|nr:TlpA family protein disulfide reductase [Streptomyces sp. NBC_01198]